MALPDDETLSKKVGSAYVNQKKEMNKSVISMLPPTGQGLGNRNLKVDAKSSILRKSRAGSVNTSIQGDQKSEQQSTHTAPRSPLKRSPNKRTSSPESDGSVSSTEIDFKKHVPIYKQFDIYGKRVMNVEEDPLISKHKAVRRKKDEPEYKQNFLAQFFEDAEVQIQREEQQSAMRDKLAKYKKDQATGSKQQIKSILKKKEMVEATAIQMPSHMSKAHRAPIQIDDQN